MGLDLHICQHGELSSADDSKVASSTNRKGANASQTTSARQPVYRGKTQNSKLNGVSASMRFDASDSLDLDSTIAFSPDNSTAYTLVFAWVDGDYSADSYLFTAASQVAYYGIEAGGAGLLLKPNSVRVAEETIAINNTNNSTVSYTFGTDVECLIIVNEGDNDVLFYNINGDLIAKTQGNVFDAQFHMEFIGGDGLGGNGFKGDMLEVQGWSNRVATAFDAKCIANSIKQLQD